MGIYHHVRHHALNSKWQVFLPIGHPTGSLLPVPTGELISDLRNPDTPDPHLGELIMVLVCRDKHIVDIPLLRPPGLERQILILEHLGFIALQRLRDLADQHLLIVNPLARRDNPIGVELTEVGSHRQPRLILRRDPDGRSHFINLIDFLLGHVGTVEDTPEHPPLDGGLVDDDTVLLVVAGEAGHRDDHVLADGQLVHGDVFCGVGGYEGQLGVVQHV